jgi:hypothetical protein
LLVHLGARLKIVGKSKKFEKTPTRTHCHTVNSHEEQLLRLDHVEERLQIKENVAKDLLLGDAKVHVVVVWMTAIVDYSIHVEVEIVKLRHLQPTIIAENLQQVSRTSTNNPFRGGESHPNAKISFVYLILAHQFRQARISLAYVAKKLWDSHYETICSVKILKNSLKFTLFVLEI